MKVIELIEMLRRCPLEMDVLLAYDSLVCVRSTEEPHCFILTDPDEGSVGVYLCAMQDNEVEYARKEVGGVPIPSNRMKGRA
jgi:hypothetical protein